MSPAEYMAFVLNCTHTVSYACVATTQKFMAILPINNVLARVCVQVVILLSVQKL